MSMKRNLLFVLVLLAGIYSCSDDENGGNIIPNPNPPVEDKPEPPKAEMDTMEYRALVYANEEVVNGRYGGVEEFEKNLHILFDNVNLFWNESENDFNYYFRFIPAELKLYPTAEYRETSDAVSKHLDEQYDFLVLFHLDAESNGAWCGGTSGGFSMVTLTKTAQDQDTYGGIFASLYPNWGDYNTLGHEFGHYRGATDVYQYGIPATNNPVNGEAFSAPKCNMNDSGEWIWSDYASAVFNYTAKWKRLPPEYSANRFPSSIVMSITRDGVPMQGATIHLYGCRGNGEKGLSNGSTAPDVYPVAFRTFTTDEEGQCVIENVERLYQVKRSEEPEGLLPDKMPYEYWFNFLVEIITEDGEKYYDWMPDLDIHREHLENNTEQYQLNIQL